MLQYKAQLASAGPGLDSTKLPVANTQIDEPSTALPAVRLPLNSSDQDALNGVIKGLEDKRADEYQSGYRAGVTFAPELGLYEFEGLAKNGFDLARWLKPWIDGWFRVEIGEGPPGARTAGWLPILADHLGSFVDPFGLPKWSFIRSVTYISGFARALEDVWTRANQ